MKKTVLAVLALAFFCGSALADSVVRAKGGLDVMGDFTMSGGGMSMSFDTNIGINLAGEYLYSVQEIMKVGGGVEFLIPRKIDSIGMGDAKISYIPIYLTAEITPIEHMRELYFKGNLGYNALVNIDATGGSAIEEKGGVYFALGAGYDFKSGLMLEALYSFYYGSIENGPDIKYTKLGLNVGYKFSF